VESWSQPANTAPKYMGMEGGDRYTPAAIENCMYSLAGHEVRLNLAAHGPSLGPPLPNPLITTRASTALVC